METQELFSKLLREDIEELERKKAPIQKKLDKILQSFNPRDIQKVDKLAAEVNNIDHTIIHLYSMIGSLHGRLKSK